MAGIGSLYKQKGSKFWWYKIYLNDRIVRKSTKETSERKAREVLRSVLEAIGQGTFVPSEGTVLFDQLAESYLHDYEVNGRRSLVDAERNKRQLCAYFGGMKAVAIDRARIESYIRSRKADGLENSSVNRELAALRRMFSLAVEHEVISRAPKIKLLREDNVRRNFLQPADFEAIHVHLPEYLKDPLRWLYNCGGRKSEMVTLQWRDVGDSEVTIRGENTKNGKARSVPLVLELASIINRARNRRRMDCPFVFHKDGKTLGDFKKAWHRARAAAGYAGTWVHDLRRSAARNLIRTPGVSMHTAMAVTGHITTSMFRRYDIQDTADVADALTRTQERIADAGNVAKVRKLR